MALTYLLFQIVISLLAIAAFHLYRKLTFFKRRGIPHDPPHPVDGNMQGRRTTRTNHEIFMAYYNKYLDSKAPFVGFYFMQKPAAFVIDLELAKNILIKDFSNFSNKGLYYNEKDDPLSAHLFNLDGPQWRVLRHKLSGTFTSGKMKFMFPTVVSVAEEFIRVMHEQVAQRSTLEIRDLVARFTVDVIGNCAFGIQCNSLRDPEAEFLRMGRAAFLDRKHGNFLIGFMDSFPNLSRHLHLTRTPQYVRDFYTRIVKETVALREGESLKRNDFMDLLIEQKKKDDGLSMDEIIAQAFIFFLAGFETSSSTMAFALYELSRHQDVQDKLRAELNDVLELHEQKLTYECIQDLKYMNQVISETLRLYTIVPNLDRKALKRYVVPGHPKFVIEEGQSVIIPAAAIHRNPHIYPKPDEFLPERFAPEEVAKRESVAWLPFGDGPRNCIGLRFGKMQARIGLALLIKNFKFSVCPETQMQFDPKSFVLGTKGGLFLKVDAI
ncbi:probable cytochrome P450 6a18 [Scaptodrosophila lebanonensis]|uniref:Probable cytochrome P450 6a18 n=1 Tax=Drosophila lebanonensis TaxID=7225 RepID=A0A6J2T198_DROLE|nr:probable cytochrome P450 6a18 [Scaptodrosophila lebanonensis]